MGRRSSRRTKRRRARSRSASPDKSSSSDSEAGEDTDLHLKILQYFASLDHGERSTEQEETNSVTSSESPETSDTDDSDWVPSSDSSSPPRRRPRRSKRLLFIIPRGIGSQPASRPATPVPSNPTPAAPKGPLLVPPLIPTNLAELIQLARLCRSSPRKRYRDCAPLPTMLPSLEKLQNLVGLQSIKQQLFEFIMMRLQKSPQVSSLNHMILAGPPGCGKTTMCHIIGHVLCHLGICKTPNVVFGTQGNMIAGFLGQTATKTEEVIRSAFGGVLVIDEASSLADGRSTENSDSFSKSCLDTLNRMLSEHGDQFVCILSGYKREIYRDILSINPGLRRRFSIHFEVEPYKPQDLRDIFVQKIDASSALECDAEDTVPPLQWWKDNKACFPHYGGDCELLLSKAVIMTSLRTFGSCATTKKRLTREDICNGFSRLQKQYPPTDLPEALRLLYT